MNKILFVFEVLILFNNCISASENTRYVWAINGLKIRISPDQHSTIIGTISFRDSLSILEESNKKHTNIFILNGEPERHPVNLKSNWVKIKSKEFTGYVIDGYLLNIPCPKPDENFNSYLDRMAEIHTVIELDTSISGRNGSIILKSQQITFPGGKIISWQRNPIPKVDDGIESEADYSFEESRYFKGFSIQELLVLLNPFYELESFSNPKQNGLTMYVRKNWKEFLSITDGGMREIELTIFPNKIILFYFFASC